MESKNGPRFLMLLTKTSFPKAVSYIYEKQEKDLNTPEMWDQAQLTGVIQKIEKTLDDH